MLERLAGAPISWGVCEVPGWGIELPRERVLAEMRELGLAGTELGTPGYFPTEPGALRDLVAAYDLELIGGFVPLVLHDDAQRTASIDVARRAAKLLGGAGATMFITAMVASFDWAPRFELDERGWRHAAQMLAAVEEIAGQHGLVQAVHPHVGTMIERKTDVLQVLDRSDTGWCLDTGHLLIGGYSPVDFLADARQRVRHVHLKDTHLDLARPVLAGERSIMEGVQDGMFCPMGLGDAPIGEVVTALEQSSYDGWYVLEQDAALTDGEPPIGQGPVLDVQLSVDYLRGIDAALDVSLETI